MGLEFKYIFGKVLSTQERPTIRLASHYCVLCLNIIKSKFNTCILTHTHTRMHLTYNMTSFIPKHISIHKVIKSQTHMRNPIIYQTKQPPKHGNKHIIMKSWKPLGSTPYKHVYHKRCVFMSKHDLPLLTLQHLSTHGIMNGHVNVCSCHQSKKQT